MEKKIILELHNGRVINVHNLPDGYSYEVRDYDEPETEEITESKKIWEELQDIRDKKKEYLVAFYLDTHWKLIARETIAIGTLNSSLAHPREVFEPAIRHSAAQLIIAHNHPSGDIHPSQDDLVITKRLVEVGELLDIPLLDHVIVSKTEWVSLIGMGKMWRQ